jgi:phage-related protein
VLLAQVLERKQHLLYAQWIRLLRTVLKNVAKFGAMAGAAFGAVSFGLVKVAEAAATSNARIEQINKSMGLFGGAAQQVTDRLIKLSETQAMATGIDRNAIKETVAKLLTFKELAATADTVGGAFDRATQSAIDLSAAGFGSATENATQLGKALNDPIKGITALNRSGVTFTAQEKEKIKVLVESGKMLEAQDTLLKAIESQVGGTATATANASDKMRQGLGMAAESLGILLLPAFQRLVAFINNTVVPNVEKFADLVGEEGLGAGLRMLGDGFLTAVSNGGKFVNTLLLLTTAFIALRGVAIAATIAQNLFNVALLKNPIGLIVTAIYLLGVGLVAAYVKFEGFRKVVHAVVNASIAAWEFMTNAIIKGINFLIDAYNGLIKIANFFGAGIKEVGKIGEVSFGRIGNAAKKAPLKSLKHLTQYRQ